MILYEYPLQKHIRTYLRLGRLFVRWNQLVARLDPIDHHYALATIFEIIEILSQRSAMKTDLLRDIDKQKRILNSYRGNPVISEAVLNKVIDQLDQCFKVLLQQTGKPSQKIDDNEWLQNVRKRINTSGGTFEFDLPSYYAWQNKASDIRQADLKEWCSALLPLADALQVLLTLWRDSGAPQQVIAHDGKLEQRLSTDRPVLFVRVGFETSQEIIPEISANERMVSVRLKHYGADHCLVPVTEDVSFHLFLCA